MSSPCCACGKSGSAFQIRPLFPRVAGWRDNKGVSQGAGGGVVKSAGVRWWVQVVPITTRRALCRSPRSSPAARCAGPPAAPPPPRTARGRTQSTPASGRVRVVGGEEGGAGLQDRQDNRWGQQGGEFGLAMQACIAVQGRQVECAGPLPSSRMRTCATPTIVSCTKQQQQQGSSSSKAAARQQQLCAPPSQ